MVLIVLQKRMKKPQMPLWYPTHSAATARLHWNFFDPCLLSEQRQISSSRTPVAENVLILLSQLATLPLWFCTDDSKFILEIWWQMDLLLALFYVTALWSAIM